MSAKLPAEAKKAKLRSARGATGRAETDATSGARALSAVRTRWQTTRRGNTQGRTTAFATKSRTDSMFSNSTSGLSNARSRIVGNREGFLADAIVFLVRNLRRGRGAIAASARQVSSVVTPIGWILTIIMVLGLTYGYALGWQEVVAASWAILLLSVCAMGWLIGRNSYEVQVVMPVNRVVVGDRAQAQIVASNPTRKRLLGVEVEIPVGKSIAVFAMPGLARGARHTDVFFVPTTRRGVIPIGPVRAVRADPIGLVRRELVWENKVDLFVHPRTIPIPATSTGLIRDLEGHASRELTSSDVSFHALREYVSGDERRFIHWKSTAKTGVHMVRQFEQTKRSHLMVALSLASNDYASDEEFEMAVSVAGSLGARAIRDARTVSVVASESTPEFAKRRLFAVKKLDTLTRTRLLDDLSRVETSATALSVIDLARVAAEDVHGISVAFLVCGSSVSPTQLRAASVSFPAGVAVVAVVCDPQAPPRLRRVTELSVLTIGYLEDLKMSLSRSASV